MSGAEVTYTYSDAEDAFHIALGRIGPGGVDHSDCVVEGRYDCILDFAESGKLLGVEVLWLREAVGFDTFAGPKTSEGHPLVSQPAVLLETEQHSGKALCPHMLYDAMSDTLTLSLLPILPKASPLPTDYAWFDRLVCDDDGKLVGFRIRPASLNVANASVLHRDDVRGHRSIG